MRNGSHRFWLGIAAVVAVTVIAVPAASAGLDKHNRVKIDSKVTVALADVDLGRTVAWHGRVKSRKHACEVHRTVKVFDVRGAKPDKPIEQDRSNRRGKWRFVHHVEPGRFYAKALRREEGNFVCRGDRSKVVDTH